MKSDSVWQPFIWKHDTQLSDLNAAKKILCVSVCLQCNNSLSSSFIEKNITRPSKTLHILEMVKAPRNV